MITYKQRKRKNGRGRAKSEEYRRFHFLVCEGFVYSFILADCTYLLYMLCYVLGGSDTREVFFSLLPSSSILRVYKQHVIDGRDKECLPVLNVTYVAV